MAEKNTNQISVFVATHKKLDVDFPKGYIPMQVNCANNGEHWAGYYHDDYGDNISEKNPYYCELTVLYSAWKNCNSSIKGLAHYRRYMSNNTNVEFNTRMLCDLEHLEDEVISSDEIEQRILVEGNDILLVMPQGPYPETGRQELEKFCYKKDIDILTDIIREEYPGYFPYLEKALSSKTLYYFNMLIAREEVFDGYCEWIFEVLGKAEERCNIADYDTQHKRIYGYFAEILLDVYFEKNKQFRRKFVGLVNPYQFMGGNQKLYEQQKKRNRQYEFLRNTRLYGLIELFYRIKNPTLYGKYEACKSFEKGND